MNKKQYLLADIPGDAGIGDQLVRFYSVIHWARMSNRSLIIKSGQKNYYAGGKKLPFLPGFRLLSFLLSNNPLSVPKAMLFNNVFTVSLMPPKRIDGVDVYSFDECSFAIRLEIAWKLMKNFLSRKCQADFMNLIRYRWENCARTKESIS